MAIDRTKVERAKPWEILAAFFGYFAVAKDAPDALRMLQIPKFLRFFLPCARNQLLEWNASPDFWLLLFFTIITIIIWVRFVRQKKVPEEKEKEDLKEDTIKKLSKEFRRQYLIRVIRSFGLVLLRGILLTLLKVRSYGTFKRPAPPHWPPAPDRLDSIDRISFADGMGIEFQYSADFTHLIIREHPKNSDQFGDFKTRQPTWADIKILLIASNIFPFWFFIYLVKRPVTCLKKVSCRK